MDFHIIIPARFQSQRLPGKMLANVAGKSVIQHTYERAMLCGARSVTIATDHDEIERAAIAFGGSVCRTAVEHACGADRLSEAVWHLKLADNAIVVNLQGDEPLIPVEAVQVAVKAMIENPTAALTTLCTPVLTESELLNPNFPKVVLDKNGFALYFSRAPIPFDRAAFDVVKNAYYRHIGLYVYRASALKQYHQWERSPLESIEMLEQLRVLWHGEKIHVSVIDKPLPFGIDTAEELEQFRRLLDKKNSS